MIWMKQKSASKLDTAPTVKAAVPLRLDSNEGWWPNAGAELSEQDATKISTVNACLEIISNSMAILPPFIMAEDSKERIQDHRLAQLLWERPNEIMTRFDLESVLEKSTMLHGDGYSWLYRSQSGDVIEEIPLPVGSCSPAYDMETEKWWYLASDPKTGQIHRLDPMDVIHYMDFSYDGIHGVSVLKRAMDTLKASRSAGQYERAVYENGGRPAGVLYTDTDLTHLAPVKLTQSDGSVVEVDTKDVLRKEWDRVHAGAGNAFRVAILDLGLKYQPIAMSNADAQFVQSKEISVLDICRFFVVPPYKVGAGKQSYNSNEQNSIEFVVQTLQPRVTQREQERTWKMLSDTERRKGHLRIRRNMSAMLRSDTKTRAETERIYRECGVYSVDDVRALEDLPKVPGGHIRQASLNFVPLDKFELLSLLRNAAAALEQGGRNNE